MNRSPAAEHMKSLTRKGRKFERVQRAAGARGWNRTEVADGSR